MNTNKLSQDEYELVQEIYHHSGWKVLMVEVEKLCLAIDNEVMSYNLSNGPENLVFLKARSEGARKLFRLIQGLKPTKSSSDVITGGKDEPRGNKRRVGQRRKSK